MERGEEAKHGHGRCVIGGDEIGQAADEGQIRRFTGNDYARDLTSGDAVAVDGWSGDAIQLQADNPDIKFVMPKEGCMLWSDNMVIPVGAPNPTLAPWHRVGR